MLAQRVQRATLLLAVAIAPLSAQRTVVGSRLTSKVKPSVEITAAPSFRYAGTQSFILYNIADAEQHFFVESSNGVISKMLWIQFESMRPGSPGKYTYETSSVIQLWNREIRADAYPSITPTADAEKGENDDGALMRRFLREKGLTFPRDVLMQRLVWVPDADKRSEVMVIYAEALNVPGVTLADLRKGASRRDELWPGISDGLLRRARAALTMR